MGLVTTAPAPMVAYSPMDDYFVLACLVWLSKVFLQPISYHIRIFLMFFTINNMKIKRLCHAFNLHHIVTKVVKLLMVRRKSLKHSREQSATILLHWYLLFRGGQETDEIAKESPNDILVSAHYVRNALLYLG